MREFAKVPPTFWIGKRGSHIRQLGIEAQHLAIYLLTNPHANMLGVYYLPLAIVAHEINLTYENTLQALLKLSKIDYCSYDESSEYIWVHDMAFDQIGTQLKPNDNRVKGVNIAFNLLPDLSFLSAFYNKYSKAFYLQQNDKNNSGLEAPYKPLESKEKDKEKDSEKEKDKLKEANLDKANSTISLDQNNNLKSQALEVLQFLNQKTGRVFRPVDTNLKLIMARLKTGITVMDCRQVIAKKTREWKGNPLMSEFLRPLTLFNASKFEQYVGELVITEGATKNDAHSFLS